MDIRTGNYSLISWVLLICKWTLLRVMIHLMRAIMRLEILTAGPLLTVASTARSIITRCATTLYLGQFLFAWTAYGINGVNLITENALDGFITWSCQSTPIASWQTIPEDDTNQTRNTSVSLHFWRSSDGKPLPWIWMDNERPLGRVWMLIGGGGGGGGGGIRARALWASMG